MGMAFMGTSRMLLVLVADSKLQHSMPSHSLAADGSLSFGRPINRAETAINHHLRWSAGL